MHFVAQELPKPAQEKPESSTATEQSKPQAPQVRAGPTFV